MVLRVLGWPVVILAAFIGCGGVLIGQSGEKFSTTLLPMPADPPARAHITGRGTVTAVLSGKRLSINGSFEGLSSLATVAHVYQGHMTGVRGQSIFDLQVSPATSGTVSGTLDLNSSQIASLQKGALYIQIHSEKAADGNLWGWLLHQEAK